MKKQPKLSIEKDQIDYNLEYIALLALSFLILMTTVYYFKLPDQIPIHFDAKGNPDNYGSKMIMWIIVFIGVALMSGLHYLNRFPHTFNYMTKITEENAQYQYKIATRMMRAMNVMIGLIFCYIQWGTIQVALGKWTGLGSSFISIAMIILFGTILYFMYKSNRKTLT